MAELLPLIKQRFTDANGIPLAGGKVYTYVAGTVTPQATYTDRSAATANPNPVILNANGEADIWTDPTVIYKIDVRDSNDVSRYIVDQVNGLPNALYAASQTAAINAANSAASAAGSATSASTILANSLLKTNNLSELTATASTARTNLGLGTLAAVSPTGTANTTTYLRGDNSWATVVTGGTVTSASVVTANGLSGTVATPTTTPAITLSTTVTGLVKGNGTGFVAATSGTDFSSGTSGLATGIVKTTTATGALTVAVAADFPTLNQSTTGNAATATTSTSFTGSLSGDVTGTQSATAISASTVTGKTITGFVSGAGTVSATDTVLSAINKLDGNTSLKAPIASPTFTGTVTSPSFSGPLTGNVTGNVTGSAGSFTGSLSGDVTGAQSTTAIAASVVTGKTITGFVSGAGTVSATDTILTAINKHDGTIVAQTAAIALKAPIASPVFTGSLTLSSTTGTIAPPSMTTTQRNAISSPSAGSILYNATTATLQQYVSGAWSDIGAGGGGGGAAAKAPTVQIFTSGSGTYTTPLGPAPSYVRVRMVGGGGGGAGSGTSGTGGSGGSGGNTTFGTTLLAGNGGVGGGQGANYVPGGGGTASLGTGPLGLALPGGQGGAGAGGPSQGGIGGASPYGGQGPGGLGAMGVGSNATANTGSGGGGGGGNAGVNAGAGGSGGGYIDAIIASPSASYSYSVGASGSTGAAGTSGTTGGAGGSGYIEVTEFYTNGGQGTGVGNPVGTIIYTGSITPPSGYLYSDGSAISRTTYASLFTAIGTTFGVGDGTTTFNIPNLQGVFLRGAGSQTIGGIVSSATLGATQGDQMQGHVHVETVANNFAAYDQSGGGSQHSIGDGFAGNLGAGFLKTQGPVSDGTNGTPRTGTETRPANVAMAAHICYTTAVGAVTTDTLNEGVTNLYFTSARVAAALPAVGTAGTYGSATQVPVITTDSKGRVTSVTTTTITGGSGTVSSASVVSANGFTGTVATATTTPAITLTTSVTGVLKGNGTALSAATSGSDYSAGTSALTTGIIKSTTTTGALTIAIAADFPTLNQSTTGNAATATTATSATTAGSATNFTGSLVGDVTGTQVATAISASTVTGKAITGFVSGAGAVTATDSILTSLNKLDGNTTANTSAIALKAPLASPTFTGTVTAPTFAGNLTGNITGTSGNVTGIVAVANGGTGVSSVTSTPTVTAFAGWDSNKNFNANNYIRGFATVVTAAGTTTLTVASQQFQRFTGTTTQTVVMPDATTLLIGHSFIVGNRSTGIVTVNASGGGLLMNIPAGAQVTFTLSVNSPAAGTWDFTTVTPNTALQISNNLSDLASAKTARLNLNVDKLVSIADANYTALATDRIVSLTSLTVTRTVTLPAANSVNAGQFLWVADTSGSITATIQIIVAGAGTDTVNGSASYTITAASSELKLFSDGVSKWAYDIVGVGRGGTGKTTANSSFNALAPSQTSNTGKYLTTDGTNTSWAAVAGSGTVTSASVVSANGFAGTVATATTTPAITVSTSVTGVLKGNGTALSAAVAGTDYVLPTGNITGSATSFTGSLAGDVTGTQSATVLASVGTPGTYGSATQVPVFVTDAKGRITSVTNTAISAGAFPLGLFGDGSDGSVTISSTTTTLTKDMFYANLTINGTGNLKTAGFRVYVNGILDISAAAIGAISNNGSAGGAGATIGTAGAGAGQPGTGTTASQGTSNVGGAGGTAAGGTGGGSGSAGNFGGGVPTGASGGLGSGGAGGTGSTGAAASTTFLSLRKYVTEFIRNAGGTIGGFSVSKTSAGGGGGGDATSGGGGGGGGSGGGVTALYAYTIARGTNVNAAIIQASGAIGGIGGAATAGNRGGGGGGCGGPGGLVYVCYANLTGSTITNALDASGGPGAAGGAGFGTGIGGAGGGRGGSGRVVQINIISGAGSESVPDNGATGGAASGVTAGVGLAQVLQQASL